MNNTEVTVPRPPVTQLRPLHSHQQLSHQELTIPSSKTHHHGDPDVLEWTSTLEPLPDRDTSIKAFVTLVSRIVVLDPGEAYCIQDTARGGFILARSVDASIAEDQEETFSFIKCEDDDDIPTDFSIGEGKALQLHIDASTGQIRLAADAGIIPAVALEALGHMLEDLIVSAQQNRDHGQPFEWTRLSVLNFPPKSRPLALFPSDTSYPDHPQHENGAGDEVEPALLHRWFEQRVLENPDRTALDFLSCLESGKRTQYTYQQVENSANALAALLSHTCKQSQAQTTLPNKTVAVLMGPCPELYISYLGALKAGMAFCPIPLDSPEERRNALMADLQPVAVLVAASTVTESSSEAYPGAAVISVTECLSVCDVELNGPPVSVSPSVSETDVAYILYTSGTTGMPKGVPVSHISVACTISALNSHYKLASSSSPPSREPIRWFQGAAPTFDISLFETFWTLSTGSTLCCAPRELTLQDINRVVTTLQADMTNITPSFAGLLDPKSIGGLMVGGETLNSRLLRDFAQYNPTASNENVCQRPRGIYNGYGPTETAIYCIAQAHVPENQRGSVLGTPLATCGVLIVEETVQGRDQGASLEPVPMGATGELVIAGQQVSRVGYLNRPNETASAFVNHARWGRVYRTGDRARIVWDSRGEPMVEFLGRLSDDQVKLSGRRVELGEVESVLRSKVEGVREALCCIWRQQVSEAGSEKIVSLVVPDPRALSTFELVEQRCHEAAARYLPKYMRPFKIFQVDALPMSASGKLDRKAAAAHVQKAFEMDVQSWTTEPTGSGHDTTEDFQPLSDPEDAKLEEALVSIASAVLRTSSGIANGSLTATTRLADAGMDSLYAMRLLRDIRNQWPGNGPSTGHNRYGHLQPSVAMLLDSRASIRSVFFPERGHVKVDGKTAEAQRQMADFSSRNMSQALEKLNLKNDADIEMILPATCTQAQLAVSFAMNRRNYISHSVLRLKPDASAERLMKAVEMVVLEQAIYRSVMLPCDDSISPFAQVILKPESWLRVTENASRVVRRKANPLSLDADDAKKWLKLAEEQISFESQSLYHIQLVESECDAESGSPGTKLLVISIAHCICDGASLELLVGDIARHYAGLERFARQGIYEVVLDWASNVDPATDKLWLESMNGWETESFGSLSGSNVNIKSSASDGGTDYGRAMVHHTSDLSWQALEEKSRALGASPLSILQAAWSLLLQLFSEADTGDITFGNVISGHHVSAHAPAFSVVPCRVALPVTQKLGQLLGSLAAHSRFAQSHRHTSFGIFQTLPYNTALALQAYAPPGSEFQSGLEDSASVFWTEIQKPAIRYDFAVFAEVFPVDPRPTEPNVHLNNIGFKLTYREDALSEVSATCIAKQFAALTEIMLGSHPDDIVQGLPGRLPRALLSAEGIIPVATGSNDTNNQQSPDRLELLHSQFESQAALTPDLLALSFYTSLESRPVELSYAELDAMANGLANILREEDVEIIPICLQRCVELYVAVLAILKAGSAWCPIDETSPIQRRTSLIARTKSNVLLTTTASLPLVEPCLAHDSLQGLRVILIDQYSNKRTSKRAEPRKSISSSHGLGGQDLAYLLWTSGTTGEPKGVMIQHSAASQAMQDLQIQVEHDGESEQVRTLQLSAYSFDVFVQDLFYTWGIAGAVISGTRELVLGTFVDFVWKSCPTHAHLTPSFGASIAVEEIKGSTLQYVTFIGEKLTEDVAEAWAAPEITRRAYNTYGPAENAVVSTMRRFYGKSRDLAKAANVGFPLNHCTSYVVREVEMPQSQQKRWEMVPRYGVGELALGGAQVAKGYLSNETKTAKSFIAGGPGIDERIYLTGDIVRLNDHGFEFLGRNDDLVKITGIRIELSEISAACARLKDQEAAIEHVETLYLQRPGANAGNTNNKIIVTFVSVKKVTNDRNTIRAQIFQKARDTLPQYMVPGHVVVLDSTMPRTASNKVDRKALQQIYEKSDLHVLAGRESLDQGSDCESHGIFSWAEEQLSVLQTIADNFKVAIEPLSPDDSLAGLGFNSLQVTKLAWSLRRDLKCTVGVLDLMRCQSLGELVDVIVSNLPEQDAIPQPPGDTKLQVTSEEKTWVAHIKDLLTSTLRGDMRPQDTSHVLPATPMQESLIVETMVQPQAYWVHRVFDLGHLGEVDGPRLKQAWITVAKQYDILRTFFVSLTQLYVDEAEYRNNIISWARKHGVQSTILQLVRDEPAVCWTSLSSVEENNLARLAQKLQTKLAPTTTIEPPWAITFVERDSKLMLSIHHALYDGVSSGILLDSVSKVYRKTAGNEHDDFLQFEKGIELGLLPTVSQREEAVSLWNSRLSDLRKTAGALNAFFPDMTQSRQKQPQKILLKRKAIPPSLLSSERASPALPTLLQSAFGCILATYLELKVVVFGQTVSQRILHPDLARVVGPAVATLPVVVRADALSAQELWSEMAHDSSSLPRINHNLHPVDIKRMLNEGSEGNQAPFPALFVYHPTPQGAVDVENDSTQQIFREIEQPLSLNVEHPLAFNIFEADGVMELTGDARRISQSQLDLMLDQVIDQARVMVDFPHLPMGQLQNRLANSLISISGEAPAEERCAVEPTERLSFYASEHPEWIAAEEVSYLESDGDQDKIVTKTITYAKLDSLVNAIASKLVSHETHLLPDDIVALHLGRDIKSLAATLAIFRAGYVYLPVDEDLPAARKQLLVRDANARLIITTQQLAEGLNLDLDSDPPSLLIPDDEDDVDVMLSWTVSHIQFTASNGGYLLYTSGSTGLPKGVRVSSSNLCHFIDSFSARLVESSPATARLGGAGKYLNVTSRAFDPHLTQLFVPLHLGYRVIIGKDRTAMLGSLQQIINEMGITHFGSVPSVLTQPGLQPKDIPSVQVVTTGGEKASGELLEIWTRESDSNDDGHENQRAILFNFYGPTEVTIGCLGHAVNRNSNARNLGLPLRGLKAILLCPDTGDEQVVAIRGQPGELCIAGPQVAMGYLNRPTENAKSFQTTSLLGGSDQRIYRTGDMMRMMHDGTLEFLGRKDQQAKIRGQRLELSEVVSFLKGATSDEGDLDFAVIVVARGSENSTQQQQLIGFVARNAKSLLKIEAVSDVELLRNNSRAIRSLLQNIEQKCDAELPAYMVPTMLWVSRIPYMAASGKVDAKVLIRLAQNFFDCEEEQDQDQPSTSPVADTNGALELGESAVVEAIQEALGYSVKATATSSVHRLGIDSLSAVHLLALLKKRGFSALNMNDILSSSCTVGSIARLAERGPSNGVPQDSTSTYTSPPEHIAKRLHEIQPLSRADLGSAALGLDDAQIEAVLPCLPLQSALVARSLVWLRANSSEEDNGTVNVPYVAQFHYRLSRNTDIARWKRSAELVIESEAMLRTCFVQRDDDGQIFQVVLRAPTLSPFKGPVDSKDVVSQMTVRPPIRLHVEEKGDSGETIVSLNIHHALFDGAAIDELRKRLQDCYDGRDFVSMPPSNSLKLLTDISEYCNLSDAQIESTRDWWRTRLHGVRPSRVGTDVESNKHGHMLRSTLCLSCTTSDLKTKLQGQSQESGMSVSLSTIFQLATALCVAQVTRQSSAVYGFVLSLRPLVSHAIDGADDFIGPCLNTLVKTFNIKRGCETLPELARRVQEDHISACQGTMPLVSVEKVQRWAGSDDKLFDSLLSINLVPADLEANEEPEPGRMSALRTQSRSDMAMAVDVDLHSDGKIVVTISSSGALDGSQLNQVSQLFEKIVCSSANQQARVEEFVSIHPQEKTNSSNGHQISNVQEKETGSNLADEGYQEALACVQTTICSLLRLKPSDISDKTKAISLYQIGLDSITVLPFVKVINKSENIKLSPDAVIKARTIQGTAKLVQEAKSKACTALKSSKVRETNISNSNGSSAEETYTMTLQRLSQDLMFVATPLQEGMLSASLAILGKAYTYVHTIQLSKHALENDTSNLDTFFAAVRDTVEACEILRVRFVFTKDDEAPWVGIVSPTEQSDLVSWDPVTSLPGRIQLRIHHALYDAISIQAVWRILDNKYRRRLQGHGQDSKDDVKYLFRPFARNVALAQRAAVSFWANLVQDYTYRSLDFHSESLQASSAFQFTLGEQELSLLQRRCRALNVTTKAALQLAWVKVLCESLYGQADAVYGEVISTHSGFDDDENPMVGPTINTIPMRVRLADQGLVVNIAEALTRVQKLNDDVRGANAMASLRKVQTLWRSSSRPQEHLPASLFQSLFVFNGVISSAEPNHAGSTEPLFTSAEAQTQRTDGSADGPSYDDYPLIASFHIEKNTLHGKLRAKMTTEDTETLGKLLETAVQCVISSELQQPSIDMSYMEKVKEKNVALPERSTGNINQQITDSFSPMGDAVLQVVKTVLGTRCKDMAIGYNTRLTNVGLDSILAIRLSKLLKKKMGINASVFNIIKGASVHDIVNMAASTQTVAVPQPRQHRQKRDEELKMWAAEYLGLPSNNIQSVLPVLTGQRAHLEQWKYNGKRFFEAPWVYRITDETLDAEKVARCWDKLCQVHEALQTTFICTGNANGLVQVILGEQCPGARHFVVVQDLSKSIQAVIEDHVHEENNKPSDLTKPPARLSFVEASDGKAVVLRLHHALYDAWTIKMIERDFDDLLAVGKVLQSSTPLELAIRQIVDIRQPDAEDVYWKRYLSPAQETILHLGTRENAPSTSTHESPLGPHFKVNIPAVVPQSTMDVISRTSSNKSTSAAILLAFAKKLSQFTKCSHPTFGLNHASRSLTSPDGKQTLDLTDASVPTLAIVPFTIDLESQRPEDSSEEHLLGLVQDHLAHLNKFAQSDGLQRFCPRFNTYLNILFTEANAEAINESHVTPGLKTLKRHRLTEPLASDYFTITQPSASINSTIEALETSHLHAHRIFFNITVRQGQGISVTVSGDGVCEGDMSGITSLASDFGSRLSTIVG